MVMDCCLPNESSCEPEGQEYCSPTFILSVLEQCSNFQYLTQPNNHLHLSLQEHPAKSDDGFGLAASWGAFDEGRSILCAFRQCLVLFLIEICLPGEVHPPFDTTSSAIPLK
jgi:hypothetical protein